MISPRIAVLLVGEIISLKQGVRLFEERSVITILTHEKALINQTENQDPLSSKINAKPNAAKETTIDKYIANINKPINKGATPFYIACQNGHLEVVKELLKPEYKTDINKPRDTGATPFYIACQYGNLEMVKEFLASSLFKSGMINTVGITGHTPLLVACLSPHTKNKKELFELLLKHGANTTHKNEANQTAMDIAIAQDNQAALSVLKQNMVLPITKNPNFLFNTSSPGVNQDPSKDYETGDNLTLN